MVSSAAVSRSERRPKGGIALRTAELLARRRLARNLRRARLEMRMSQRQVADLLGVGQVTVSTWETGRCIPRPENLLQLAELYGRTVEQLTGRVRPASVLRVSQADGRRLGANLRRARVEVGLTQADAAARLDTDPERISTWERGVIPATRYLLRLADLYGRSVHDLWEGW
jgi:transcriptional regulator with XRE-family HTH domain